MKRRYAFTLVELLVVIGIIAVLISLLLPALGRARAKARDAQCLSNLHQITLGALVYAQDNHGALPPMRGDNGPGASGALAAFIGTAYAYDPSFTNTVSAAAPQPGAILGRLAIQGYLGGKLRPDASGNVDFSQAKVLYCPNSYGNGSYFYYQFNWHLAYRAGYGTNSGTAYLQPWFKNIKGYGKAPAGATLASQIGSTTSLSISSVTSSYAFPISPMSMANCTLDPYSGFNSGTLSSQAGTLPHDYGARRTFLLAFSDGHAITVPASTAFWRKNNNQGTLLDFLYGVEGVNQGAKYTTTANGAWAPILSN